MSKPKELIQRPPQGTVNPPSILDEIERHASEQPEAIALIFEERTKTYRELNATANHLAHRLRKNGVGPETPVGLCSHRGFEAVIGWLGIWKAGGVCVPLDPAYPHERLDTMAEVAGLEHLVTTEQTSGFRLETGASEIRIESQSQVASAENLNRSHKSTNLAYILFTSGSTGKPKGVAMPHSVLDNLIAWQSKPLPVTGKTRVLQFAPGSFDVSFQEICSTLAGGGTLVLVREEQRRDPAALIDLINKHKVDRLYLPVIMLHEIAREFSASSETPTPTPLLDIITAGEQLRITPDVRRFFRIHPNCRLHNHYGPTETHVVTATTLQGSADTWPDLPTIGVPIDGATIHLLDENGKEVADGTEGEIFIGGRVLARGYHNDPERTAHSFRKDPHASAPAHARRYKTGDIGRQNQSGEIEYIGRRDDQVKINGFRIELGEVEAALSNHPSVAQCAVACIQNKQSNTKSLAAWYVPKDDSSPVDNADLHSFLVERLPPQARPASIEAIDTILKTPSGKVDRRGLIKLLQRPVVSSVQTAQPSSDLVAIICEAWAEALGTNNLDPKADVFALGANSLVVTRAGKRIAEKLQQPVPITLLFEHRSCHALANAISQDQKNPLALTRKTEAVHVREPGTDRAIPENAVAIIGMAGRFPGAPDIEALWKATCDGRDLVSRFEKSEMSRISPDAAADSNYVPARGVLKDADCFDAAFFGITPREAKLMDPQQRVFLETCWHALEDAGRIADRSSMKTGVFAGQGLNTYFLSNLCRDREYLEKFTAAHQTGEFATLFGTDKDYLATRVAHKLDLRGPALTVQAACSTSLVAVVQAVQSLLSGQSDMCLAGGVSISFPQERGHRFEEGAIVTRDGACRPFDADSSGTVFGSGAGVVVLRRLEDAIANGDRIHAVIRGAAINNDGAGKSSYSAPSSEGQAQVISAALEQAEIEADSIRYVETHGTGTPLGDPIELAGLTRAFRDAGSQTNGHCALGSIKANVGHLESAAGVTGLIRATLAVREGTIPPMGHFKAPNKHIHFDETPFYVPTTAEHWPESEPPRRAGVSAFGVGGTNAHLVIEQAPAPTTDPAAGDSHEKPHVFTLSARSPEALKVAAGNLADHLDQNHGIDLADVAFTLRTGRELFDHRLGAAAADRETLVQALRHAKGSKTVVSPDIVFLFPGQGSQRAGMARDLYHNESSFRETVDTCAAILDEHLDIDIRTLLLCEFDDPVSAKPLKETRYTQPALFVVEYAIARLLETWGIKPSLMIGHSVGEYVAACLAGVFSLEDALFLVAHRGSLVQAQPAGSMLSVRASEQEIESFLNDGVSVAAVNAPGLCVVAGPERDIGKLEQALTNREIVCRRLETSHAFHSAMMDPVVDPLREEVARITLNSPTQPIISTVTGEPMTESEATDPEYWARHARLPVRFSDAISAIEQIDEKILIEVGPGRGLAQLARLNPATNAANLIHSTLPFNGERPNAAVEAHDVVAKLWAHNVEIDWPAIVPHETGRLVSLPLYPFARERHWVEPPALSTNPTPAQAVAIKPIATEPSKSGPTPELDRGAQIRENLLGLLQDSGGIRLEGDDLSSSFFDLGFDSLLLTDIAREIRNEFNVDITFRELVEKFPTPGALAKQIEKLSPAVEIAPSEPVAVAMPEQAPRPVDPSPASGSVERVIEQQLEIMRQQLEVLKANNPADSSTSRPIEFAPESISPPSAAPAKPARSKEPTQDAPSTEEVPLTEAQIELFLASQLGEAASAALNISMSVRLEGKFDRIALQAAVDRVVARHGSLRATILPDGSAQRIHADPDTSIRTIGRDSDDFDFGAWALEETSTPFDLEKGPLARFHLFEAEDHSVFVITVHHIICDGWSLDIILGEISELYGNLAEGRQAGALPEAFQISEWAGGEQARRASQETANALEYWKAELASPPRPPDLPEDFERPEEATFSGHHVAVTIPRDLADEIRTFAANNKTTLFTVLFSAFGALVNQISDTEDMLIGVPVAGQNIYGVPTLVGHCVNYLPIRQRINPSQTIHALMASNQGKILEGLENAKVSLGQILKEIRWRPDPSRPSPLTLAFNLDTGATELDFGEKKGAAFQNPGRQTNGELAMNATDTPDGLLIEVDYATDVFAEASISQWINQYVELLRACIRHPDTAITDLLESGQVSGSQQNIQPARSIGFTGEATLLHRLFEKTADKRPDATAVVFQDSRFTYREIDDRANQLANHLVSLGASGEKCVGIAMERSADYIVAVLGVLKSGAAMAPIDISWPEERQKTVANDSSAVAIVTNGHGRLFAELDGPAVVDLTEHADSISAAPRNRPFVEIDPGALAYVIFTSGSTGKPKGVMVDHGAISLHIQSISEVYSISDDDCSLAFHSVAFDPTIEQIFCAFHKGARLVVRDETLWTPAEFAQEIQNRKLTVVDVPPSYWLQVLQDWQSSGTAPALDPLRMVIVGGEALPPHAVKLWRKLGLTKIRLMNCYGPTECCVTATVHEVSPRRDPREKQNRIPIGIPHGPVDACILDDTFKPVESGERGELCIGGPTLARGYLGRDDLTKERFITDPRDRESRIYRTGDQARFLPDGSIEFLERMDRQVQVRGFRVELGEVENQLSRHPHVANCAVIGRRDAVGSCELAAFVETKSGTEISSTILRDFLSKSLPPYMVPAHISMMLELPVDGNGKVDRRALANFAPKTPQKAPVETSTDPVDDSSLQSLVEIWKRVLNREEVGIDEDFFTLGGHSLLAMTLIKEISSTFGKQLTLAQVLRSPTIQGLARHLETPRSPTPQPSTDDSDSVYQRLTTIWRRVLNRDDIETTDDFFDLGGHSLLAMSIIKGIADEFQQKISLAEFLKTPTIQGLAGIIMPTARESAPPAIASNRTHRVTGKTPPQRQAPEPQTGTTLFNIPGIYGYGLVPKKLAEQIAGDRQYFDGLQLPGADGMEKPLETVEEMATHLIDQIRKVQPQGPYALTGYCFGGLLTYEVAAQLQEAGDDVRAVVIWDAFPAYTWVKHSIGERLANGWRKLVARDFAGIARSLKRAAIAPIRVLAYKSGLKKVIEDDDPNQPTIYHRNTEAGENYRIKNHYRGQLFVARGHERGEVYRIPPKGGWEFFGQSHLVVEDLDCHHQEMQKEPILSHLCAVTAEWLRMADRRAEAEKAIDFEQRNKPRASTFPKPLGESSKPLKSSRRAKRTKSLFPTA